MVYGIFLMIMALGFGVLSAYHTKAFIGASLAGLPVTLIIVRNAVMLGGAASVASGVSDPLHFYRIGFGQLPTTVQVALVLFPALILIGRAAASSYRFLLDDDPELKNFRKINRLMNGYGRPYKADQSYPTASDTRPGQAPFTPVARESKSLF